MAADGSSGLTEGGAGIPNIDSVKSTIRAYYNAPGGIADKSSSPYITQMKAIEAAQWAYLDAARDAAHAAHRKPALVFDADDTTLWTYDMEDSAMHFNFDPALQNTWVMEGRFPATPGMVSFVNQARKRGFAIFGITGRRHAQEDATLANLDVVGYKPFKDKNFFTKWDGADTNKPAYVTCVAACTTVEFKANTRKYIESQGYEIVLNVGDQWSDLQGGYADRSLKLPNPTYYLPSPNLPGVSEPALAPRTEFTMLPDGSSGLTEGGEGIPNIDSVKSTIRTYYDATAGIAAKDSSPYISELAGIEADLRPTLVQECADQVGAGGHPAVVFDADDTTLWTYDMEDGAMHFNFDPVLQDTQWVQPMRFPATPGMVDLVNAVGAAGCTVVGLTGRRDPQRTATLGNLDLVGYDYFTEEHYFTKWASGTTPDPTIFGGTPCENNGGCSTIQYKSAVRRYVESQGYDIIANVGDQFSDLIGGYADQTVKLPNPTYYLP
jgi:predicted secreted acid phosphatase